MENSRIYPAARLLLALFPAAFVCACATPARPYVEPAAGPTASIRFVSESDGSNLSIVRLRGDPQGCACSQDEPEVIGILGNKAIFVAGSANFADKGVNTNQFTVRVPADGTSFRFLLGAPSISSPDPLTLRVTYCQAHQSFTPEAGKRYEVVYNAARNLCGFDIFALESQGRQRVQAKNFPMCAVYKDNADGISDRIRARCAASSGLNK